MLLGRVPVCPLHGTFHNCLDITFCLATCLKRQLPHLLCHIPPAAHAWHNETCNIHVLAKWRNECMDGWRAHSKSPCTPASSRQWASSILCPCPPLWPMSVSSSDSPCQKHWAEVTSGRQGLEDKSRRFLAGKVASLRPWKEKYQQEWARVEVGVGWGGRKGMGRQDFQSLLSPSQEMPDQGNLSPALKAPGMASHTPPFTDEELRFRWGSDFLKITN